MSARPPRRLPRATTRRHHVQFPSRAHPAPFRLVTPGIRGPLDAANDQKRTLSIGEAFALGADHIVVGRPLLEAADPLAVLASYEAAAGLDSSSERMMG